MDAGLCQDLRAVMGLAGYVIVGIKIAVPVILIIMGMTDLIKAVTSKDDKEIKNAQTLLIKKVVSGVVVFLVMTLVGLLTRIVGGEEWKTGACQYCLNHPTAACCKIGATSECSTTDMGVQATPKQGQEQ